MDRSLAARLGRPFAPARRPSTGGRRAGTRAGGSASRSLSRSALALGGTLLSTVWKRPRLRLAALAALATVVICSGGWLLLRDSSLVAVDHVQVSGVHGPEAGEIEAALGAAAKHMTTLDVHRGALEAAVASFRVVSGVRVSTSFPHRMRISVIERLPVAALEVDGSRTAVAADGAILGPALLKGPLPTITTKSSEPRDSGIVGSAPVREELTVLGAAPSTLTGWVTHVYMGREGLTVAMRNGLLIYFGDATRPHAKWMSAARVLADPTSAGAIYVDVRLPERPAAGTTDTGVKPSQVSASDPTAASLAASLASAIGGGSSPSSPSSSATTPSESGTSGAETGSSGTETGAASGTGTSSESTAATGTGGATEAGSSTTGSGSESGSSTQSSGTAGGSEATRPATESGG